MRAIRNSGLLSFVLVMMVWSCVHIIKLPNPISKMAILKIIILTDSKTKSKSELLTVLFYGNPLNSARLLFSNGHNHYSGYQNRVYE
jgi:hypothetical protein